MIARGAALALGLALLCAGCGSGDDTPAPDAEVAAEAPAGEAAPDGATGEPAAEQATEEVEQAPEGRQIVRLYFVSLDGKGLVGERNEIFETASPVDRAKQILSDLIAGPASRGAAASLPRNTRLRQVYVLDNGVAWADFGSELSRALGGGSTEELLAVYSIVDSLALNIPEIRRVGILLDGQQVDTLNGHLDLRRPLPPNRSLIHASVTPRDPAGEDRADAVRIARTIAE